MKRKNEIIIVFIVLLLISFLIFSLVHSCSSIGLRINTNIWLEPASKSKTYFEGTTIGGESYLEIWEYKKDIKKVIKNKGFKMITEKELSNINKYIEEFYNGAAPENKEIFDKVVSVNQINKEGNYYYYEPHYVNYKNREGNKKKQLSSFILLIADTSTNKLYYCIYAQ
mgnify:FL=1